MRVPSLLQHGGCCPARLEYPDHTHHYGHILTFEALIVASVNYLLLGNRYGRINTGIVSSSPFIHIELRDWCSLDGGCTATGAASTMALRCQSRTSLPEIIIQLHLHRYIYIDSYLALQIDVKKKNNEKRKIFLAMFFFKSINN